MTATLLTVTPGVAAVNVMLVPERKLLPVRISGTAAPWRPLFGVIELSVGAGTGLTVKLTLLLVPAEVVTENATVLAVGPNKAGTAKFAVICVALTTVMPLTEPGAALTVATLK